MADRETTDPARRRAKAATGLMWHVGVFVIVNGFLWAIDLATDPGVDWAFWTTLPWAVGLAFHALAYLIDGRQVEDRLTRKYEERRGD
ncbi:2TM domain-containing protein [Isoptericola sp. b515]|uniref:2TM domain-containing protein n=1 Tax=Isoptericola sp. b515 TaxID=3064652 RepID=UPI002713B19D|nr:2TM domain-containing protein [Isoptericola sp. b515]MDO8149133.1 2TM domain-containing protein [Isoptericola sp. b515]